MKLAVGILAITIAFFAVVPLGIAGESLEYKLAVVDADGYVAKNHISVARFRSLLRQLSDKYVESKQSIADMTVKSQQMLRDEGISEKMLSIMEGMNSLFARPIENQKYAEYISAYAVLRMKGQSHADSIAGLKGILRAYGVY